MATVQRMSYFVTSINDEPGALLKIMKDLKNKSIGLSGLWGFGTEENKAQFFVIAKDSVLLRKFWNDIGLISEEGSGFFVRGEDRTGALIESLEKLVRVGINIRAIDALAIDGLYGSFIWVGPNDVEKAARALGVD